MTRPRAPHDCDATVPVCPCGHRWALVSRWSDGTATYSDVEILHAYRVLYGEPGANQLQRVEGEPGQLAMRGLG